MSTALVCHLLEKKVVSGAILTRMSKVNPLVAESFVARTVEEVFSAQGSKYCPTQPLSVLRNIKDAKEGEKFVFVGLPCHIHGLRKLQNLEQWAREKIIFTIGLFCGHGITSFGFDVILRCLARGINNIDSLHYRGRGWPGNVYVKYKNGDEFKIPHNEYWPPFFAPYFFTPRTTSKSLILFSAYSRISSISVCSSKYVL